MVNIIKSDLYRIMHELPVKIMLIISMGFFAVNAVPFEKITAALTVQDAPQAAEVIHGCTAFASVQADTIFMFFAPFLIVSVFSSEFSNGTLRSICVSGPARWKIFAGKYAAYCVILYGIIVFSALFSTVLFTIAYGWGGAAFLSTLADIFKETLAELVSLLVGSCAAVFLSLFIRSGAAIVLVYFGLSIAESVVYSAAAALLGGSSGIISLLIYIFPSSYIYELSDINFDSAQFLPVLVSVVFYILAAVISGALVMNRRDVTV